MAKIVSFFIAAFFATFFMSSLQKLSSLIYKKIPIGRYISKNVFSTTVVIIGVTIFVFILDVIYKYTNFMTLTELIESII